MRRRALGQRQRLRVGLYWEQRRGRRFCRGLVMTRTGRVLYRTWPYSRRQSALREARRWMAGQGVQP